jgi:hypothetical protein
MAVDRGCADSEDVERASTISVIMLSQRRRSLVSIDLMNVHRRNLPHSDSIGNPCRTASAPTPSSSTAFGSARPVSTQCSRAFTIDNNAVQQSRPALRCSSTRKARARGRQSRSHPLARTPARSNPGRATVTSTVSAWFGGALSAPGSPCNAVVTVDVPSGAERAAVPSPALTDVTIFRRMGGFPARRPTRCAAADRVANTPRRRMRAASADWDQDC